jgi:hypothetical protein
MPNLRRSGKDFFEGVLYNAMFGFCNFFWNVADKLDDFAAAIEVDEAVLETVPRQFAEKKRKKIPSKKILGAASVTDREITGDLINVHHILTGFDEDSLQSAKKRTAEACMFILGNAETKVERHIARQFAKMLRKGVVLVTDADLVLDKKMAGCFIQKKEFPISGLILQTRSKQMTRALFKRWPTSHTTHGGIFRALRNIPSLMKNGHGIPVYSFPTVTGTDTESLWNAKRSIPKASY